MTSKGMSCVVRQVSSAQCYLLGSNRITPKGPTADDYSSVVIGLSLFLGVLLDFNEQLCLTAQVEQANKGRIRKYPGLIATCEAFPLEDLLLYLDELDGVLIETISSELPFKADALLKGIRAVACCDVVMPLKRVIISAITSSLMGVDAGEKSALARLFRLCHQLFSFLKKLDVDRPDLAKEMEQEFFDFEESLTTLKASQKEDLEYAQVTSAMRQMLHVRTKDFSLTPFVPKHGPGAVADPHVKSQYDKNRTVKTDARVSYLLAHEGLGMERDYLPFIGCEPSTRSSRYITVPKSWKKLRGISAEPAELQFWQQGVLFGVDKMFRHDKWWSSRVNLHCQQRSRDMALLSSITGSYATIDLSAASDSVSLQLVKDVFGNTPLARWLLGTRSTHTLCGDKLVEVQKFSPMGSACCFPVECIVFLLASEVACSRTPSSLRYAQEVVVYGDDIIIPYYAVDELLSILNTLGFTINLAKSYWKGNFREACGVEAWYGFDIAPCRFRSYKSGFRTHMITHGDYSGLLSLANDMLARGLHTARAWLLEFLFSKKTQVGRSRVSVQTAIFASFSGARGTLASPIPTNFQLRRKFCKDLWSFKFQRLGWQRRPICQKISSEMSELSSTCDYVEWLIRHQTGVADFDKMWEDGWIESRDANPYDRLPIDQVMVPTIKWVLPPEVIHSGV